MGKSIERGERVTACQEANLGEGNKSFQQVVTISIIIISKTSQLPSVFCFYSLGGNSSNGGNDDEGGDHCS